MAWSAAVWAAERAPAVPAVLIPGAASQWAVTALFVLTAFF